MQHAARRRLPSGLVAAAVVLAACAGADDDAARSTIPEDETATASGEPADPPPDATSPDTSVATSAAPVEGQEDSDGDGDDSPAEGTDTGATDKPRYLTVSSDHLFDPDRLHTFEIELTPDALAEIDSDPTAEEYVEGRLTFDGETVAPIGVRYKGSVGAFIGCTDGPNPFNPSGAKTCRKLSMKLKMNWVDSDDEFYGVKKVQLHSQNLDPSKMHERLGYWLFREMGVPAPRSTHARVVINGEYVGLFALTEQIDGRFTRERFADGTGNLYKEVWPFDADGAPRAASAFIDGLETNEDEDPTAALITAFADEFDAATPDERQTVLERWTDVETLLTTIVVDRAIKADDGPLHWYCVPQCEPHNFYWYEDPTERRLTLIPWDLDNSFDNLADRSGVGAVTRIGDAWGEVSNDCEQFPFGPLGIPQRSAACDPLLGALAALDDDFDRIRADLVAGPMSATRIDEVLDSWIAQIEPAVAESAAAFDDAPSVEEWREQVELLRGDLERARSTDGR